MEGQTMTDEKQVQEQADEKQINEAFQELLSRYLESKHRKKVEIITKAFNFARQATQYFIITFKLGWAY